MPRWQIVVAAKTQFMVQIGHKRSIAPFSECINYLRMLQASLDEALKLISLGLCVFFFVFSGMIPFPCTAVCKSQPDFPGTVPVVLPVTPHGSQPSSWLFENELLLLPRQSYAS